MSLRILFVSHEASATGAPIFLLHFAKWLKQHIPDIFIATIIIKNGQMYDEWCELGPVITAGGLPEKDLLNEVKLFYKQNRHFDIAYFNTIESSHILALFEEQNWFGDSVQTILHAHELEGTVQKYGADKLHKVCQKADKVFAASQAVKKNLVAKHGFDQEQVRVIYPCARDLSLLNVNSSRHECSDSKMVLGCGEIAVVKGTDLFVQVCKKMTKETVKDWPITFQWVGANLQGVLPYLKNDLRKLNLEDKLFFVGHQDNVHDWFSRSDVFFLSSREDSCPLVCLEAASLGLPIVYFAQSGGMDEVLGDSAGFPVPYMDIDAAAKTILHLLKYPEEGVERGKQAREIYQRYHTPHAVYSTLFNQINDLIVRREECLA